MIIKRIEPTSAAKVAAFIYAVIGLVAGLFVALLGSMFGSLASSSFGFGGVTMIVVLPILYGVIGFIGTFIAALVYNFAAGKVGGIQLDVE